MLAVMALERHGLTPGRGEILVTGAAGPRRRRHRDLAKLGYSVARQRAARKRMTI